MMDNKRNMKLSGDSVPITGWGALIEQQLFVLEHEVKSLRKHTEVSHRSQLSQSDCRAIEEFLEEIPKRVGLIREYLKYLKPIQR